MGRIFITEKNGKRMKKHAISGNGRDRDTEKDKAES